ncbi:P2Y purinoceptor 12-like [Sardina pilchardus]|uniref:P2Y purinoceptor 12-like n=1 Tax=Sardina pilchardus TaxID=27697 RepID=UPI002E0F4D1C
MSSLSSLWNVSGASNVSIAWNVSGVRSRCVREVAVAAVLFPCLYGVLLAAGLLLNAVALWIFLGIRSSSTFLVYLKNLLAADLLMALTLPFKLLSDAGAGGWRLRAFYCRYSAVLFYVSMYISILLLGLISLDRYLKVVRPFKHCPLQKVPVGRGLCAVVWATMLALALPNMVLSNQTPNQEPRGRLKCRDMKSPTGLLWHEGFNYFCQVLFWGTLLLMVVCYTFISKRVYQSYRTSQSSSRAASQRTKAKVFVVVGVFFVCFAPFHFARVPYTLSQTRWAEGSCWTQQLLYVVKESALWLCTTNVCVDPLIYVFLCRVFRRRLTATLRRKPLPLALASPSDTSTNQQPPPSTNHQPPPSTNHQPPPSTNHQPPPSTNHHPPPSTNHHPPPSTNHHPPPSTNHQPPPSTNHHPPPSTNQQQPPSTNQQQPPTSALKCPAGAASTGGPASACRL